MNEKPIIFSAPMVKAILAGEKTQTRRVMFKDDSSSHMPWLTPSGWQDGDVSLTCPYQAGQRLWVRETWSVYRLDGITGSKEYPNILYRADNSTNLVLNSKVWDLCTDELKWRPSIFMPRWASRITLQIVRVRAQRVQDISEDDAAAEGIKRHSGPYILDFAKLWDSINAKRGYSWKSNPWVWVYDFEVSA